jgi:hypothetical protein
MGGENDVGSASARSAQQTNFDRSSHSVLPSRQLAHMPTIINWRVDRVGRVDAIFFEIDDRRPAVVVNAATPAFEVKRLPQLLLGDRSMLAHLHGTMTARKGSPVTGYDHGVVRRDLPVVTLARHDALQ